MSSTTIVCSPTRAQAGESHEAVEAWLLATFPAARVTDRDGVSTRALAWEIVRPRLGTWLDGSIDAEREAFYLKGDLDLICETAVAAVALFPPDADVIVVSAAVGTMFDLRRVDDARQLADAWDSDDEALLWIDPNGPARD